MAWTEADAYPPSASCSTAAPTIRSRTASLRAAVRGVGLYGMKEVNQGSRLRASADGSAPRHPPLERVSGGWMARHPVISSSGVKIAAAVAAVLLLLAVPAADAAKRKVPSRFVGSTWDGSIRSGPQDLQARQFPKMAVAGVETVRVAFHWGHDQPEKDGPTDLREEDRIVGLAASHGMEVFPHIIVAPTWNRWDLSDQPQAPPSDPELLRPYMKALIERFGPRGTFWVENPTLPRLPIHYWQFWNEPHLPYQWTVPKNVSWSESYAWELQYFYIGVKENDPTAKVVLAGLTNESWIYLDELYDKGVKP